MKKIYYAIATVGGAGFSPVAPGTMGALVGALLAYFFHFSTLVLILGIVVCSIVGVFVSHKIEQITGRDDPGLIVVDELVGQWINLLFVPFVWKYYLAAFLLFRFFDIVKPWPVRQSQHLPYGVGVVLDDILAGIYGLIVLHILLAIGF